MIEKIGVIGSGTMGHGIAETFALSGYQVNLYGNNASSVERGMEMIRQELDFLVKENFVSVEKAQQALSLIVPFSFLGEAVRDRDYIIEAIPEVLERKQKLFQSLDELCGPEAILTSNTSSLSLQTLMEPVRQARRERMMICHWYNPAHLIPLVELSFFGNMPEEIFDEVAGLYSAIGKQTTKILKDVPGLIANRILQAILREVFSLIEQGVAEPMEIDKALKFGPAFRYATTGPLQVVDFGGLDVWCTVGDNLLSVMDASKEANPVLRQKVVEGKLGLKSGEGFFKYHPDDVAEVKEHFMRKLIQQLKASQFYT